MTSNTERIALYARLQEVLGPEPAATLMTMLPSGDELATKADLASEGALLRADMAELRSELKGEMAELRSGLKGEMAELRSELKGDMAELRSEMAGLKIDVGHLQEDMREVKQGIRDLDVALHNQVRTFVVTQTATVFGVAGLVVAIQQLL